MFKIVGSRVDNVREFSFSVTDDNDVHSKFSVYGPSDSDMRLCRISDDGEAEVYLSQPDNDPINESLYNDGFEIKAMPEWSRFYANHSTFTQKDFARFCNDADNLIGGKSRSLLVPLDLVIGNGGQFFRMSTVNPLTSFEDAGYVFDPRCSMFYGFAVLDPEYFSDIPSELTRESVGKQVYLESANGYIGVTKITYDVVNGEELDRDTVWGVLEEGDNYEFCNNFLPQLF